MSSPLGHYSEVIQGREWRCDRVNDYDVYKDMQGGYFAMTEASIRAYLDAGQGGFVAEFLEFLRIPSISTAPERTADVRRAAQWTVDRMHKAGFADARLLETGGHPVVYGASPHQADKPTVLIYCHYDVQPPEPLELWETPPFEPRIDGGCVFARGASDTKGNVLVAILACEAWLKTQGALPVNVKLLFEGEEEVGSPSLATFIEQNRDLLACDLVISADGGVGTPAQPLISMSTRGLAGLQIRVQTAATDLHSGNGGLAPNALHALVAILASLRDETGRILVEGFYDDVLPLTPEMRTLIAGMPLDAAAFLRQNGIKASFGEPDYTPVERSVARPTLELNGMWGGYQGAGTKTVIPREAYAKITCRLVARQSPETVMAHVKRHIEAVCPDYADVTVQLQDGAFPYLLPNDHPGVAVLQRVLTRLGAQPPAARMGGGTVPVMGMLKAALDVETVTIGGSQGDERLHAPNEFYRLANFRWAQEVMAVYLGELAVSGVSRASAVSAP